LNEETTEAIKRTFRTSVELQPAQRVCEIGISGCEPVCSGTHLNWQPFKRSGPLGCMSSQTGIDTMKKKSGHPGFDQTLDLLREHGFEVSTFAEVAGGVLVAKHGAGAVLVAAKDAPAAFAVSPGILVKGEVGRLLDRGYQKFIKTSQYEIPASATQLQAIHAFSEELKQVSGAISLYNESLGTTSDLYEYDRLRGREHTQPPAARPWELADEH
jgi:hypothetical protein